jgi:hypothetical protein
VVLWFYFEGNDLIDLQEDEKNSAMLMNYLQDGFNQNLPTRQNEIDRTLTNYMQEEKALELSNRTKPGQREDQLFDRLMNWMKLAKLRERLGFSMGADSQTGGLMAELRGPDALLFARAVATAKRRVKAWGGELYFVYLPNWTRYANQLQPGEKQRENVMAIVKKLGVPIIDIYPVFQAQREPMSLFPFRAPGHYNEAGHRLVAEEVLKRLSNIKPDV